MDRLRAKYVSVRRGRVAAIRPAERQVTVEGRDLAYDHLVIALGAQLQPAAMEGFEGAAHHPYSLEGAVALGRALRGFRGGKVVIGISKMPFKCPAAPYEMALLMDYDFRRRGMRDKVDMEFFTPEPYPAPAAGEAIGKRVEAMLVSRGIPVNTKREMTHIDSDGRVVHFKGDGQARYDLLVAVPPHGTCEAVRTSGLTKDGPWVPVDPYTLRTSCDDVYAVGDVTKVPTPKGNVPGLPKAGVFAEREAQVVARNIASEITGEAPIRWEGDGVCFLEVGYGKSGMVMGNFYGEGRPVRMRKPSRLWHWGKVLFERRWLRSRFR